MVDTKAPAQTEKVPDVTNATKEKTDQDNEVGTNTGLIWADHETKGVAFRLDSKYVFPAHDHLSVDLIVADKSGKTQTYRLKSGVEPSIYPTPNSVSKRVALYHSQKEKRRVILE